MKHLPKIALAMLATLATSCASLPPAPEVFAAGYQSARITDANNRPIALDIWYPAPSAVEAEHNYGISKGRVATSVAPTGDHLPLVLLSHGAMGAAVNYSWAAETLARHGYVVVGVSHYGESPAFGPATVSPMNVSHFGDRTRDFNAALAHVLSDPALASHIDADRIGVMGHSSGGTTALMLAGAAVSIQGLADHCRSDQGKIDMGCRYPPQKPDPAQAPVPLSRAIRGMALLDPALGPGFTPETMAPVKAPALVIGSRDNDFIPFNSHAGHIMELLPTSERIVLATGEGHFVYLDACDVPIQALGVPICKDRDGVDRTKVHERLGAAIVAFFDRTLGGQR